MDDTEAIRQLKARYFRLMDTKDWDGFRNLFTTDVRIDVSSEGSGVFEGVDAFLAMLVPTLQDLTTVHHGHMPEIELTSATTAAAVWAMEDHLWWPEGGPLVSMHGYGHYHDTYRRTDDGWRISSSRLTRLRVDFQMP